MNGELKENDNQENTNGVRQNPGQSKIPRLCNKTPRSGVILLIIPIWIGLMAVVLNNSKGPYWLGTNLDPEYVYLLNALNMAEFQQVKHIDHPGTPVQVLGAVTLRIVHGLTPSAGSNLHEDVLKHPEFYLRAIDIVMVFLNMLMSWFLGLVCSRFTRSKWISMWMQITPFLSDIVLINGITRVSPEPLLLFSSMALLALIIIMLNSIDAGNSTVLPVMFAAVTGFGIAVKITFLPMAVIPLVLFPGLRKKINYLIMVAVSFVLFTLPIIGQYGEFFKWIRRLTTHTGRYGTGETGIISLSSYFENMVKLLTGQPLFAGVMVMSLIVLALVFWWSKAREILWKNPHYKFLAAVVLAQAVSLLMVSKHAGSHYLMPALCLNAFAYYCIYELIAELASVIAPKIQYFHFWLFFTFIAVVLIYFNNQPNIREIIKNMEGIKTNTLEWVNKVDREYKNYAKIYWYPSSSPYYALKFGNDLSGNYHAALLSKLYKNVYFYDFTNGNYYGFSYSDRIPLSEIRSRYRGKVIFQGSNAVKIPGVKLKKVSGTDYGESMYVIDPKGRDTVQKAVDWIEGHVKKGTAIIAPAEMAIFISPLQDHYNVLLANYRDPDRNYLLALNSFLHNPYYIVPTVNYLGKGSISPKNLERLSQFRSDIEPEAYFPDETDPDFYIARLKPGVKPGGDFKEIAVWDGKTTNRDLISPALNIQGGKGEFKLDFASDKQMGENVLTVSLEEWEESGEGLCRFGYSAGQNRFNLDIPQTRVVYFKADVCVPGHLANKNNYLFIQDYIDDWQREKVYFTGSGWFTYVVAKEIRPGSQKVFLGVVFTPKSKMDQLKIKNTRVFFTPKDQ